MGLLHLVFLISTTMQDRVNKISRSKGGCEENGSARMQDKYSIEQVQGQGKLYDL